MVNHRPQETILTLYRGCRDLPASEFKEWAMETVRGVVAFDSGIWVTSDIVSDDFTSVYLFHQTAEMMENYGRMVGISEDRLAQAALAAGGGTVMANDLFDGAFLMLQAAIDHARRYGMAQALCTSPISPVTRIATFISFYRANPNFPFSEFDQQTKELLVPHMIEAMRINLFSYLHTSNTHQGNALAICDPAGILYETTPLFADVLHEAWPEWSGPRLPLPLDALEGPGSVCWAKGGIKFEASPCRDLFLLSVAREDVLDRLSPRQIEIAKMLVKGKRYKDIARELGISPSTVTNHVNQIHTRLDIDGREDLIRLFSTSGRGMYSTAG